MSFRPVIQSALHEYDRDKGGGRRLFGDHPAIVALRQLPPEHQDCAFKIFLCFIKNKLTEDSASWRAFLHVVGAFIKKAPLITVLQELHFRDPLTEEAFNTIIKFNNCEKLCAILQALLGSDLEHNLALVLQKRNTLCADANPHGIAWDEIRKDGWNQHSLMEVIMANLQGQEGESIDIPPDNPKLDRSLEGSSNHRILSQLYVPALAAHLSKLKRDQRDEPAVMPRQ